MKKLILFMAIFGLGAVSFYFFDQFMTKKASDVTQTTTTSQTTQTTPLVPQTQEPVEEEVEDVVTITDDGTLLDGPFVFFDAEGEKTDASVRQVISPEERLVQFIDFDIDYPLSSHVYFATDKTASVHLDLGPAKMHEGYLVYGIPLDADLAKYAYILIYNPLLDETMYYARIK